MKRVRFIEEEENIEEDEMSYINYLRPIFNRICYNSIRACIIHLLVKAKDFNHALPVEEIAFRLGKRHSVILFHLEKLEEWKIVVVVRKEKYGKKKKRSVWGLNSKYTNLVREIYFHILKTFFTVEELDRMCSVNKNVRKKNVA